MAVRESPMRANLQVSGYAPRRRPRWGTLLVVSALHLAALAGLVRVFAPDFTAEVVDRAGSLVTVTVTAPPEPSPTPEPAPSEAGVAAEEGRRANPRETRAPEVPLPRSTPAPRASATGEANTAGPSEQGAGSGAGGSGEGTGSGAGGTGSGGGARPLEKIAGDISNARDYPRAGRAARRGHDVVIELTVGPDGRVSGCRITDPSPDPEADAITCRLAAERFQFRPRLNAAGESVAGVYRWRQRWF